jgi:hypothetical protein
MWIITNKDNPDEILFWSNEWGWITDDIQSINIFTDEQHNYFNLPIGGQWELSNIYGIV